MSTLCDDDDDADDDDDDADADDDVLMMSHEFLSLGMRLFLKTTWGYSFYEPSLNMLKK